MPDGKEIWVTNEWSGQVSIIDRAKHHVTGILQFGPPAPQIDVTPVGLTTTRDGETAFVALEQKPTAPIRNVFSRRGAV